MPFEFPTDSNNKAGAIKTFNGGNEFAVPSVSYSSKKTWASQVTTDSYADIGTSWDKDFFKTTTIIIKNTGTTNGAHVKVLGSVDGVNFDVEVLPENLIAASGKTVVRFSDYYTHIKIQVKAATAGAQTNVEAIGASIAA
jgi:hypothetical protein